MRVERGYWSGPSLVRGVAGRPVADLGGLRPPDVLTVFAGNDSASMYGKQYLSAARGNYTLTVAGSVLAAVGLAQHERLNAYTVIGATMLVVSIPFQINEQRTLSRAVWWYNSALAGGPAQH
ncbi:MAG: hypothetical protein M3Z05_09730 [Gemmatimonadota bacterium]|nr:hypothetical protein [Gemmatimonadota bacterium]